MLALALKRVQNSVNEKIGVHKCAEKNILLLIKSARSRPTHATVYMEKAQQAKFPYIIIKLLLRS